MNGIHDVGGMHGFGTVEREPDPPRLEPWEATVVAIQRATRAKGFVNIDEFRHAIERMGAVYYLESPYFEHWLVSFETVLTEKGYVDRDELAARAAADARGERPAIEHGNRPVSAPAHTSGWRRPEIAGPRFAIGDQVITRQMHPAGHTRLARYARGKTGVIHALRGTCVFADTNAHGSENPQQVYSVRFSSEELWGDSAEPGSSIFIDLWESHLRPARD